MLVPLGSVAMSINLISSSQRLSRVAHERPLCPFGSRALNRMIDNGLPPRLEPPLRFLFDRRAPASAEQAAALIERLRAGIAAQREAYRFKLSERLVPFG